MASERFSSTEPSGVSGNRLRTNWRRLNGPSRIAGVDLARGLAIVGMFAAHLLVTADGWVWSEPSTWLSIVDGRSSILFATLAGVSIGLMTGGRSPLPHAQMSVARQRLALRAAALFVLGILLVLTGIPVYVILPAYAILFLLALPLTGLATRVVFSIAAGIALVMPFAQPWLNSLEMWTPPLGEELSVLLGWNYPFTLWIAFVLAGLGVARAGITRLVVQVRMLVAGGALAVLGYALAELPPPRSDEYWASVWTSAPHSSGLWEAIGTGGFVIAVLAACLLLCRLSAVKTVTLPLRATGAMPLTAYTAQLLVWAAVALVTMGDTGDLMGFRMLEPFWPLTLGMIVGCTLWALFIGRGPLEWALDRVSRIVPSAGGRVGRLDR